MAGIRPILCRQERVGMAIADGFSRSTGGERLGVFRHAAGARLRNAFPGAAQAFADNVPVLLIPGGEPTSRSFTPPRLQRDGQLPRRYQVAGGNQPGGARAGTDAPRLPQPA